MVTPPSLVPRVGGRVKTDRRDSRKLAAMLAGGFLRRIHVLRPEERAHCQSLRTRNQIERHRRQTQNQIKSLLLFHGKRAPRTLRERWSEAYLHWIETLSWDHQALKTSPAVAGLRMYRDLTEQYKQLTQEIELLALTEKYRERAGLLTQIHRTSSGSNGQINWRVFWGSHRANTPAASGSGWGTLPAVATTQLDTHPI